jgi:uncharacterized RDD family membrane protein YckC
MNLDPAAAGTPDAPRYAGFWIRFWANGLDLLMYGALQTVVVMVVEAVLSEATLPPGVGSVSRGPHVDPLTVQIGTLWSPLVVVGFWIAKGATPGKMICGLRIVDSRTGRHPTPWQFVGRYLLQFLSAACAGLGYLWIAIDARNQAWHDKIVGTVVVRTR